MVADGSITTTHDCGVAMPIECTASPFIYVNSSVVDGQGPISLHNQPTEVQAVEHDCPFFANTHSRPLRLKGLCEGEGAVATDGAAEGDLARAINVLRNLPKLIEPIPVTGSHPGAVSNP